MSGLSEWTRYSLKKRKTTKPAPISTLEMLKEEVPSGGCCSRFVFEVQCIS
jgi:hypothetical protein